VIRCSKCVMPNSRPDTAFVDGVCSACVSYAKRPQIDWETRKAALLQILDRHDGRCIVPSSGGKDSHYQVLTLLELGADVTVVTAATCHLTPIGRANINNLARYARTIEVTPNRTVRAKLNRLGLELVGDISWPEHVSIFTTPFRVAKALGINLMFYGESPQNQYGGPIGTDEADRLTARWRSEFGGFLGLRPSDMIGKLGITERDMSDYLLPDGPLAEAYFLGQFIPWNSHRNADVAIAAGMHTFNEPPSPANWWIAENLDNWQTCVHDYVMYEKYGFGRGCQQISVDVRTGRTSREYAMAWLDLHEGYFSGDYAGVSREEGLEHIGMSESWLANQFKLWSCSPAA